MKKITHYLLFLGLLFVGLQDIQAQDRPEVAAKQQLATMTEQLQLDADQQRSLFRALVLKESDYAKNITDKDEKSPEVARRKQEIDARLDAEIKKILTDEQYARYKQ